MTISTEACQSGMPGRGCPGSILFDARDRTHGTIEFCGVCDVGHQWDAAGRRWRARPDLCLARLETD